MITSVYFQDSTILVITAAHFSRPVRGVGKVHLVAVDLAKGANIAVAVVNADLSWWKAAPVLFRWFTA